MVPMHLNLDIWEWHEQTGQDVGTDMILEYIENETYTGLKIECQIKGRSKCTWINGGKCISFDFPIKTLLYAWRCRNPFFVFLVDVQESKIYFLYLQEYIESHPDIIERMEKNKETVAIHFPRENVLKGNDEKLVNILKII